MDGWMDPIGDTTRVWQPAVIPCAMQELHTCPRSCIQRKCGLELTGSVPFQTIPPLPDTNEGGHSLSKPFVREMFPQPCTTKNPDPLRGIYYFSYRSQCLDESLLSGCIRSTE